MRVLEEQLGPYESGNTMQLTETTGLLPLSQEPATFPFSEPDKSNLRRFALSPEDPFKYVEIKCQLDATEDFIADLIACSICFGHHYANHQELKIIIQWLLPVVFRAVVFQVAGLVWS